MSVGSGLGISEKATYDTLLSQHTPIFPCVEWAFLFISKDSEDQTGENTHTHERHLPY